ncbi:MAG: cysteine synthase A [Bacillota bacterium]|nr:cysteine synthase A [Bacillota bacterium]
MGDGMGRGGGDGGRAGRVLSSILEAVGRTPLVELGRLRPAGAARIVAKVEALNPSGSVKARPALAMVRDAERRGLLTPDSIIVEASSGNQGIALSMVCAVLGYRVKIVMPRTMSPERQEIMQAYGAEVILTEPGANISETLENALRRVRDLAAEDRRVFVTGQFDNPANPAAHRLTTAAEIVEQLGPGARADAFVAGVGTGGTLTGAGGALKQAYPGLRVIAVEPAGAALLSGGQVGDHIQQGIGDGIVPQVLDRGLIDEVIQVTDEDAVATARLLARKEGLLVGVSAGSNVWAAMRVAERLGDGKTVVTLCPDTGERYLSLDVLG